MIATDAETQGTPDSQVRVIRQDEFISSGAGTDKRLQFEIAICPDEDGGYYVVVPELAGVVTEAETIDDAMMYAREAIEGALLVYKECGETVPLRRENQPELPADCIRKWVVVNG